VPERCGYSSIYRLRRRAPELCDAIAQNYRRSVRSGEQKWAVSAHISSQLDLQAVLEAELSKDIPRTIGKIAHSLGYAAAGSLREAAPQLCKKIAKKRSVQLRNASLLRMKVLSLALLEEPAPSLEELRDRLNCQSTAQLRSVDRELCKSLCKRYRMRVVKERDCVRSLIEDYLKKPNPRWKTIEHDTGWIRFRIRKYLPDLYARARLLCKETSDSEVESDLNVAEARVRYAVEHLLARRIQPSIQKVYRVVPNGPYLGGNSIGRILRKIRQEEGLTTTQVAS
jgi:hypothetical protein